MKALAPRSYAATTSSGALVAENITTGKSQEGFNGFVVKSDRGANKFFSTSLWSTEADMFAGESGEYFQDQISRVVTLLAGPPLHEHYRVDIVS